MNQAMELQHVPAGPAAPNMLLHAKADLPSGLYRIRIPAGTQRWRVSVNTYRAPEIAQAWLRMDQAPEQRGTLLQDTRHTLERLSQGEELHASSPENSGALTISTPESTDRFVTDRQRWLYLELEFPAGRALSWQSRLELAQGFVFVPPSRSASACAGSTGS